MVFFCKWNCWGYFIKEEHGVGREGNFLTLLSRVTFSLRKLHPHLPKQFVILFEKNYRYPYFPPLCRGSSSLRVVRKQQGKKELKFPSHPHVILLLTKAVPEAAFAKEQK